MFSHFFHDARLVLLHRLVDLALEEDGRDLTSEALFTPSTPLHASIVAKEDTLVAGLPLIAVVLGRMGCRDAQATMLAADGDEVARGAEVARILGPAPILLKAERVIMNFICRLSGVANATRRFVREVEGTGVRVLDTRKTTPGLRVLQKHAVLCGGGQNHRHGLYDAVLIKDNHRAVAGGVTEAVTRARHAVGHMVKIEVEVDTLAELDEALRLGVDAVLLDNMELTTLATAVGMTRGRAVAEASGGITPATARDVARTGVDMISIGWLTHSTPSLEMALDVGTS